MQIPIGYCNVQIQSQTFSAPSLPLRLKEMGAIQQWLTQSSLMVYYKIPNRVGLSHYTDSILLCDQGDAASRAAELEREEAPSHGSS